MLSSSKPLSGSNIHPPTDPAPSVMDGARSDVSPSDDRQTQVASVVSDSSPSTTLADRVRIAADVLEAIVANRALLADLTEDERTRLLRAAGQVSRPDAVDRRRLVKATKRQRKADKIDRIEQVLANTGIRKLRREAVFITPNIFPPKEFEQRDITDDPDFRELIEPQNCYICKKDYSTIHHFYDQLCPICAELNYRKRTELADLRGRVALLTGGRVKIGYQAGIKLLRSGAELIVTTRFPRDSAQRYAQEPDFAEWGHRLTIYGLDLRHTPSVEEFCRHLLATRDRLDFIINNACQTVRRPPDFYRHIMEGEAGALHDMPESVRQLLGAYEGVRGYYMLPEQAGASHTDDIAAPRDSGRQSPEFSSSRSPAPTGVPRDGDGRDPADVSDFMMPQSTFSAADSLTDSLPDVMGLTHAAQLSQVPLLPEEHHGRRDLFPQGRLDQDLQQVDLRDRNSWRMLMADVPSVELLEVHLVNAVAPFLINARLKPLMLKTPDRDKHIVNVSAVEGQFYRMFKTTRHPHTNMAKAALNMMTRTSASDYYTDGIHMNSVDTGWVTDEDPVEIAARKTVEHRFHPPLDIVDGAARIVDPIIAGVNTGEHAWGQFLKDYFPTDW